MLSTPYNTEYLRLEEAIWAQTCLQDGWAGPHSQAPVQGTARRACDILSRVPDEELKKLCSEHVWANYSGTILISRRGYAKMPFEIAFGERQIRIWADWHNIRYETVRLGDKLQELDAVAEELSWFLRYVLTEEGEQDDENN